MIITISGQFGSGGEDVGILLEKTLGYKRLGKELIARAAASVRCDTGIATRAFYDEDMSRDSVSGGYEAVLLRMELDVLPAAQAERAAETAEDSQKDRYTKANRQAVQEAAEEGNCILLGRCAAFYLRRREDCIHIFTVDSLPARKARLARDFPGMTEREICALLEKTDARRAAYYEYYTGRPWGVSSEYDFIVNVGCLGERGTAELLAQAVRNKETALTAKG